MRVGQLWVVFCSFGLVTAATTIVQTNDDGWAEANIRAAFQVLQNAGYDVVLSAPAENQSGTGSLDFPALPRLTPCEFDSCPSLSPPQGSNASEPRLNYVNSFPVTSVKYGIKTVAPLFFGTPPDLVVSGPNVGGNTGLAAFLSGTIGAASEAGLEEIPAIAFSGATGNQRSYAELATGDYSFVYAELVSKVVDALVASGAPYLPSKTVLNVNFPSVDANCASAKDFKFVLTRILPGLADDVETCGTNHLPLEASIAGGSGCLSSISVFNANTKLDSNASTQAVVLDKLQSILTCV